MLLGLQLGGPLGNLIDRLDHGAATGFVKLGVPNLFYSPNSNVADVAIACGVVGAVWLGRWLTFYLAIYQRRQKRPVGN